MAFLARGKKIDLVRLAIDLDLDGIDNLKVIQLKTRIQESEAYKDDLEFVQARFEEIIAERIKEEDLEIEDKKRKEDLEIEDKKRKEDLEDKKRKEDLEDKKRKEDLEDKKRKEDFEAEERKRRLELEYEERKRKDDYEFQLQKLKLQDEATRSQVPLTQNDGFQAAKPRLDLQTLIQRFDPVTNDISLYLVLFERQAHRAEIPRTFWASHLIGLLPHDIAQIIAREVEEVAQDYEKVKQLLLKRYKLTPEKFRQLFTKHLKCQEGTWTDFAYELRNYFQGWITGLEITTFEELSDLMVTDQIKRRVPQEVKEHFIDDWTQIKTTTDLVQKLDDYETVRPNNRNDSTSNTKKWSSPRFNTGNFRKVAQNPRQNERNTNPENKPAIYCYGCSRPGFIKAKCPTCSPTSRNENFPANSLTMYTCHSKMSPIALIDVCISGVRARVCADTGASRSVAGEILYNLLKRKGVEFQETSVTMTLANGYQTTEEACTATVSIEVENKTIILDLLALPNAKGNRTLLGTDFLEKSEIVLDIRNKRWNFCDNPRRKVYFGNDITSTSQQPVETLPINSCNLREEEGESLNIEQRLQVNNLLQDFEESFKPGGESTPFIEHRINTGTHAPVAYPPYRVSPAKKEILKKELDDLLQKKIIEGCESPCATPQYVPGDKVYMTLHPVSKAATGQSKRFMPRRDGPYVIRTQRSPSTFEIASLDNPQVSLGVYHTSALKAYTQDPIERPCNPFRKRGRPPNLPKRTGAGPSSGLRRSQRGRM